MLTGFPRTIYFVEQTTRGDVKKALAFQRASAEDWQREQATQGKGMRLYAELDENDRGKAEAFMQGLLSQDKYSKKPVSRKKHA